MWLDELLRVVEDLCSAEEIKNFLRTYWKPRPRVFNLSAPNKHHLVEVNLRAAAMAGMIPPSDLFDLLRRAEEDGSQHLYYFKPRKRDLARQLRDGKTLAAKLREELAPAGGAWGPAWSPGEGFPRIEPMTEDAYGWSDFRVHPLPAGVRWAAKLYGRETHLRPAGRMYLENGRRVQDLEPVTRRVVVLLRWLELKKPRISLLELRVSLADGVGMMRQRLEAVLAEVGELIEWEAPAADGSEELPPPKDFDAWDLVKARHRLLDEQDANQTAYRLGAATFKDLEDSVEELTPYNPDDPLYKVNARHDAVKVFLEGGCSCTAVAVTWEPRADWGRPLKKVRMIVGGREPNELVFPSLLHPSAATYLIDQVLGRNR